MNKSSKTGGLITGHYGHLYSADIHVSTMVPKNAFWLPLSAEEQKIADALGKYMKNWTGVSEVNHG